MGEVSRTPKEESGSKSSFARMRLLLLLGFLLAACLADKKHQAGDGGGLSLNVEPELEPGVNLRVKRVPKKTNTDSKRGQKNSNANSRKKTKKSLGGKKSKKAQKFKKGKKQNKKKTLKGGQKKQKQRKKKGNDRKQKKKSQARERKQKKG